MPTCHLCVPKLQRIIIYEIVGVKKLTARATRDTVMVCPELHVHCLVCSVAEAQKRRKGGTLVSIHLCTVDSNYFVDGNPHKAWRNNYGILFDSQQEQWTIDVILDERLKTWNC